MSVPHLVINVHSCDGISCSKYKVDNYKCIEVDNQVEN